MSKKNATKTNTITKNKEEKITKKNSTIVTKKDKHPKAIILEDVDLVEKGFRGVNTPDIVELYPKVHPVTGSRIYGKGYYWLKIEDIDKDNNQYIYNDNGYTKFYSKKFMKVDKEFVNKYDKSGKIKIIAHSSELDIMTLCIKDYDKNIKDKFFMAPLGYYWKYFSERCYYSFEWYELAKIK
jgi:hypothetical protein